MNKGDNIDSTIDHWLSSHPHSNQTNSKSKSNNKRTNNRSSKKTSKNFDIHFDMEPKVGLDDLVNKEEGVIEKATPSYRWSSFADADSMAMGMGMGMDQGMADLRGFAGQLTPTALSLTPSARLPTGNFSSLHVDDLLWDSASPSSSDKSTISFSGAGTSLSKGKISSIPVNPQEESFRGKNHLIDSDTEMEGPDGVWFANLPKTRGEREGTSQQDASASPSPSSNVKIEDQAPRRSSRKIKNETENVVRKARHSDSTRTIHSDAPKSAHRVRSMVSEPQLGQKLSGDDNYTVFEGLLQQMGMVGAGGTPRGVAGSNRGQSQGGSSNFGSGNGNGGMGGAAAPSYQAPSQNYVDHSRSYTTPNPSSNLELNSSSLYQRRSSRESQDGNSRMEFASGYPNSESYSSRGRRHPGLASAPGGQRNMTLRPSNEPASAGLPNASFSQQQHELFGRSRAATVTAGMPLTLGAANMALDPNSPRYGAVALNASNTSEPVSSIDPFGSPNTSSISRARSLANFHALHAAQQVARLGEKQDFVLPSHQFRDDVNNQRAAGAVRAALLYGMEQSIDSSHGRRKSVTADPGGIDKIELAVETPDTPSHPLPRSSIGTETESISSRSSNSSLRFGNQWPNAYPYSNQSGSFGRSSVTTNTITPPSSVESHGGPLPEISNEDLKRASISSSSFNTSDALMLDVARQEGQQQMTYGGFRYASLPNQSPSSSFREFVDGSGQNEAWGRLPSWSSTSAQPENQPSYPSISTGHQLAAAYEFPTMNQRAYGEVYQPAFTSPVSAEHGGIANRHGDGDGDGARNGNGNGNQRNRPTREASPQKTTSSPELKTGSGSITSRPIAARGRASSSASKASKSKSIASVDQSRSSKTPPVPPERISSLRKRKSDAMISPNQRLALYSSATSSDASTGGNVDRDTASLTSSGAVGSRNRSESSSSSISPVNPKLAKGKSHSNSPKPPKTPASGSHSRQVSSGTTFSFVNFGVEHADELCAAVTPSGSYKTPLKNRDQILKGKGKKSRGDDDGEAGDDEDLEFQQDEFGVDDEDDEEGGTPTNKTQKRAAKKRKSESHLNKSAGSVSSGRRGRTTSNK